MSVATLTDDPAVLLAEVMTGQQQEQPYEHLDRLRQLAPIYQSKQFEGWFLTRYEDCLELLRSSAFDVALGEHLAKADPRYEDSAFLQNVGNIISFMNPPQHTRCRRLVSRTFSPRSLMQSRNEIEQLVDECLRQLDGVSEFDFHQAVSRRVPGNVICTMMDIPVEDRDMLLGWSDTIAHALAPVMADDALAAADEVVLVYWDYILELAEKRRAHPGQDLISELVTAEGEEGKLTQAEFVGVTHSMITAGIETAQGMLSSGILAFVQNPAEIDKLLADPSLAAGATEETLRLQAPVQIAFQRIAKQDTRIGGQPIAKGEVVNAMIGAGNYDPAAFGPDPHAFRIDRENARAHLTFGNGIHLCVGAALARMEGEITFPKVLQAMPDLQLVERSPHWRPGYMVRSQDRLLLRRSAAN
jgi:cytochrome P450